MVCQSVFRANYFCKRRYGQKVLEHYQQRCLPRTCCSMLIDRGRNIDAWNPLRLLIKRTLRYCSLLRQARRFKSPVTVSKLHHTDPINAEWLSPSRDRARAEPLVQLTCSYHEFGLEMRGSRTTTQPQSTAEMQPIASFAEVCVTNTSCSMVNRSEAASYVCST